MDDGIVTDSIDEHLAKAPNPIIFTVVGIFISFFIDPIFLLVTKDPTIFDTTKYTVMRTGIKLLLTPFIMGLGYEFIKYAGKHENIIVKILSYPGLLMQRITTVEPTDDIIEVAIESIKAVLTDNPEDDMIK